MSLTYSPKIATDGLLMCLDASNNKSYPTDLPVKNGLALWLDAADDATFSYSSGTSVSQWRDKSGLNNHSSQATVGSQPSRSTFQNSRKTVNFDGTNDTVTIPNFVSNSEMSIFVVSNCGNTLFIEHSNDVNSSATGFYIYGQGNGMFLIRRNSTYYYLSLTDWLVGGYSIASGVNSTGLDLLTYKNGTQQSFTNDGRSSLTNSYATNTLYIGSRGANSLWSSGPIAEIIIYNRKVTDTERKQVHTYLGQKWGISNTDRSIVDLSGNNKIISLGGDLGSQVVADMPTFDYYNKGAFFFDGSTDTLLTNIPITATPALSNFTYEMWTKLTNFPTVASANIYGLTTRAGFLMGASSYAGAGLLWYGNASGTGIVIYGFIRGADAYRSTSGYSLALNQYYHLVLVNNYGANKLQLFVNGSLYNEVSTATAEYDAGNIASAGNIGIAKAQVDGGGTQNYTKYAGSVPLARIYNKALSAAEVLQNYEAQKSKFANTIVQQGLVLNLDADNPYSYAGAGTTWYDVSGNGYQATMSNLTSANWVSYNGVRTFETNDTYDQGFRITSFPFPASRTYEIWINSKSFSLGWQTWFDDGGGERILFGTSTNTVHVYPDLNFTANLTVGTWYQLVYTLANGAGSACIAYVNGVSIGSGTYNSTIATSGTLYILGDGGSEITSCYCSTVRVYNRVLSAAEVLQNYNATKGKFGL
jgi:hypothetical protein